LEYLLEELKCLALPSAILIRSDLIRKRQNVYDETNMQSDAAAFLNILNESDFGYIHKILTFTRIHEKSTTSRLEKKYLHMLNLMRIWKECAPKFLSEEQAKQVIKRRERIFYILFARSLLFGNTKEVFNNVNKQLQGIDYEVKYGKLFLFLIREILVQPIKAIGIK